MNKRLKKLLETQPIRGGQMLDCYNQAVSDLAVTITTRVDASNMIYIAEDMKLKLPSELTTRQGKRGKTKTCTVGEVVPYLPHKTCFFDVRHLVADTDLLPFAVTTRIAANNQQYLKEYNMNEDKKTKVAMTLDGTYEHSNRIYDVDALAPTMQTCGGGNREPKILTRPHGYYKGEVKEKVAPAVKASAYAENNYLQEPICLNSKVNGKQPSVQDRIYSPEGTSTAITTCFHVNIQEPLNAMPKGFRIRKLTPRECFRLMDVSDKDIDTIQAAGISDSQQYKLAGNSIVVNVLTEIFRKLLVDTQNDDRQLRMF